MGSPWPDASTPGMEPEPADGLSHSPHGSNDGRMGTTDDDPRSDAVGHTSDDPLWHARSDARNDARWDARSDALATTHAHGHAVDASDEPTRAGPSDGRWSSCPMGQQHRSYGSLHGGASLCVHTRPPMPALTVSPDGPVLDPFLIKVVKATVKVNPLLLYERDGKADCLAWNMIFRANNCCRSTDPSRSWTRGRNAPATHPRVTQLRIISRQIPWVINIRAQDHSIGVTCGEVIDGISHFLQGDCARRDYDQLDRLRRRYVWDAYVFNRSTDPHVPGGELGEALKRLDWLGPDSKFGGLVVDEELVKEACGDVLPCVFELKCLPRDLPTPTSSSATS